MLALSWSGGKDSALALEALRDSGRAPDLLLSTVDEARDVLPHHDLPLTLLRRQAKLAGLPLIEIAVPSGTGNENYEARLRKAFEDGPLADVTEVAFGDLFLADLRAYRESRMAEVGRRADFPLWGRDTRELAGEFAGRFAALVCAVDLEQFPQGRPGVAFDSGFLAGLPQRVDPCGENGEFHTFVHGGPVFDGDVDFEVAECSPSADGRFLHTRFAVP